MEMQSSISIDVGLRGEALKSKIKETLEKELFGWETLLRQTNDNDNDLFVTKQIERLKKYIVCLDNPYVIIQLEKWLKKRMIANAKKKCAETIRRAKYLYG